KRNRDEDLTLEDMLNGIRQLKDAGIKNLVFSGGEPLLRRDLIKILRFAKVECQIPNIVLITNGTIYNKAIIAEMSKFVDTVSVSVDSYSAECPSFIRDSGIFNRIMDTVSLLKENGNNVNLIPTV
ncbi:radical SAM protein, partial [Enterococcus gallinarum]